MRIQGIRYWIEISASAGIIAGLIMVWLQMQQNAQLLKTQLIFEEGLAYVQGERVMLGENPSAVWEKAMQDPAGLSLEEQRIIEAYFWSYLESWRTLFRLYQEGLVSKHEWSSRVAYDSSYVFGNAYGRAFLRNFNPAGDYGKDYGKELIELVRAEVLNSSEGHTKAYFQRIQRAVREEIRSQ
jgi:hypothetical protein